MEDPEAIEVFCWLRINVGQTGKTLKENKSPIVNPFRLLRFNRNLRLVHPGLQKYFKEEGLLFEDHGQCQYSRIVYWPC